MMPTETKGGLGESFPIQCVFTAGRWEIAVVLHGRTFTAFGITADRALENLANEIRKGESADDSTSN